VAVICEIMSDDGSMARLPELREFAAAQTEDRLDRNLIKYRRVREN